MNLEVGLQPKDEENMEEHIFPSGMITHIGPVDMGRRLLKRLRTCKSAQEGKLRWSCIKAKSEQSMTDDAAIELPLREQYKIYCPKHRRRFEICSHTDHVKSKGFNYGSIEYDDTGAAERAMQTLNARRARRDAVKALPDVRCSDPQRV